MTIIGLETREFATCEELLEQLLHDDIWMRRSWKYRGQGNREHKLVPSALRLDTKFFSEDEQPAKSNKVQIVREWSVLKRFATFADNQGLPLPGFDRLFSNLTELNWLVERCARGEERWPLKRLQRLMALAQHYGVPTRMLDWTRAPLVGLYFAAYYAAKEKKDKSQITLYALNEEIFELYMVAFSKKHEAQVSNVQATLRGIDVPNAENPNITAQKGTFTCIIERRLNPEDDVPVRDLEQIVDEFVQALNHLDDQAALQAIQTDPLLVKLVAPGEHAGRLLKKLAMTFDVMGSTVFPGFGGAAMAVQEKRLWGEEGWSDETQVASVEYLASLHQLEAKP